MDSSHLPQCPVWFQKTMYFNPSWGAVYKRTIGGIHRDPSLHHGSISNAMSCWTTQRSPTNGQVRCCVNDGYAFLYSTVRHLCNVTPRNPHVIPSPQCLQSVIHGMVELHSFTSHACTAVRSGCLPPWAGKGDGAATGAAGSKGGGARRHQAQHPALPLTELGKRGGGGSPAVKCTER